MKVCRLHCVSRQCYLVQQKKAEEHYITLAVYCLYSKTTKSQLMHVLEGEVPAADTPDVDIPSNPVVIIDGNALIHSRVSLPETFGQLAMSIFKSLPQAPVIHFVTDYYHTESIKGTERERRGISSTQIIGGPMTKLPRDFSTFLHNSENKKNLIKFPLGQWQRCDYSDLFNNRIIFFVCEADCYCLEASNGSIISSPVPELQSSQEEADTRIILNLLYETKSSNGDKTIIVRSPDTDVLVLLVYYAVFTNCCILFDTGVGNKRRLLSVRKILSGIGNETAKVLPGFHAFTGCDCTSAFVRKGKKLPYKIMSQNPLFVSMFQNLESNAGYLPVDLNQQLEQFVCAMYGKQQMSDVNRARYLLFKSRYGSRVLNTSGTVGGTDLSLLPPCSSALLQHCKRANYQTAIWKAAEEQFPKLPAPDGNGWKTDSEGQLQITWTEGAIMPLTVLDLIAENADSEDLTKQYTDIEEVEEDDSIEYILDLLYEDEGD
jgi:hypothetical protein